jgi:hypothetical protein
MPYSSCQSVQESGKAIVMRKRVLDTKQKKRQLGRTCLKKKLFRGAWRVAARISSTGAKDTFETSSNTVKQQGAYTHDRDVF